MQILSLFDGMSCGYLAFNQLGVDIERYAAYEIDDFAVQVSEANLPIVEHKGDVFKADFKQYKGSVDWLIGGSPCTYWSIGQSDKRETIASGLGWELFSQYARALKESEPEYFLYENNKSMSDDIKAEIVKVFGFEPFCINSAAFSAQNRQRYYWVGQRQLDGTYLPISLDSVKPCDIQLDDVLDVVVKNTLGVTSVYATGDIKADICKAKALGVTREGKAFCLTAGYSNGSGENIGNYAAHTLEKSCKSMVAEPVVLDKESYSFFDKEGYQQTVVYADVVEYSDLGVPVKAVSVADNNTYVLHRVSNGCLTIKGKQYKVSLADGYYILRKFTVNECKRLQTVPEWFNMSVPNKQAYKLLGNGWTVSVIAYLIQNAMGEDLDFEVV